MEFRQGFLSCIATTIQPFKWNKYIARIRRRSEANTRLNIALISIFGLLHVLYFDLTSFPSSTGRIVYIHGYTIRKQQQQQQSNVYYQKQRKIEQSQTCLSVSKNNDDFTISSSKGNSIRDAQEEKTKLALIQALLIPQSDLLTLQLDGKAILPSFWRGQNETIICAILSSSSNIDMATSAIPALVLPLNDNQNQWKLLSYTYDAHPNLLMNEPNQQSAINRRPSRIVLIGLNAALMNRDGGLFDNLPYSTWTIDPERENIDFSNNPIASKFHVGKRRAYNRLLSGIDSYGYRNRFESKMRTGYQILYSPTQVNNVFDIVQSKISNIFTPLRKNDNNLMNKDRFPSTQQKPEQGKVIDDEFLFGQDSTDANDESLTSLSKRILEVRLKELEMDIVEWDYQIALARAGQNELEELYYENYKRVSQIMLAEINTELIGINERQGDFTIPMTSISSIESFVSNGSGDVSDATRQRRLEYDAQYVSSYAMIREIIREQLNAEVIGTALEQISLLDDDKASVLGGVLILRRLTPKKKVRIAGEDVVMNDNDETYGNDRVTGGETILIECQPDEAIGMHIACASTTSLGLFIEKDLFSRSVCMVRRKDVATSTCIDKINNVIWETTDPEVSILMEGQALNQSSTDRVAPIRIARTSLSFFDTMMIPSSSTKKTQLFPTDNPIKSLEEYDSLSREGKAHVLMTISNFNGKLPRPRVLRVNDKSSKSVSERDALDELLLPLVDEAVRNQYLIREAMDKGDLNRVNELEQSKSEKQIALDNAQQSRQLGYDDEAEKWENEADFYSSLRADPTQDIGSYSRFLDSDEWYERQRREIAKGVDKSKFGSLLDGIE